MNERSQRGEQQLRTRLSLASHSQPRVSPHSLVDMHHDHAQGLEVLEAQHFGHPRGRRLIVDQQVERGQAWQEAEATHTLAKMVSQRRAESQ